MVKVINKNLRVALIAIFAIALFAIVNYCVWDNANASNENVVNDVHGGMGFTGVWSDEENGYVFSEELGNFRNVKLENDEHARIEARDDINICIDSEGDLKGGYIDWRQENFPESYDDYNFINHDDWSFYDVHFTFGRTVEDEGGTDGENCFFVTYSKNSSSSESQRFKLYFKITSKKHSPRAGEPKIFHCWDMFKDKNDILDNGEALERAGHNTDYGDLFKDALSYCDETDMITAISDGRIKIELEKVVCQRED